MLVSNETAEDAMLKAPITQDTATVRTLDAAHFVHPFTGLNETADPDNLRLIVDNDGCWLTDDHGTRVLDGTAGLWCVNVGYGREELVETAASAMARFSFASTFFRMANEPCARLAEKVTSLLGERFEQVFFSSSGSEANDTAYRLIRAYWEAKGEPQRKIFIGRVNGYHGSTLVGTALGGMKSMHDLGGSVLPDVVHVPQPYHYMDGAGEDADSFGERIADALEAKIREIGPDRVACFYAEPIQASGGVIVPPESYWPRVVEICRKYGVLIAADEVVCGFGRLGQWFGHMHYGYQPDVVTMAKGISSGYLPLSATALSREIYRTLQAADVRVTHGYTYSGHPVAAALGLKNIEIIEREGLVPRVRETAAPAFEKMLERVAEHPLVGNVRSVGLLGGIEIVRDRQTRERFDPAPKIGGMLQDICWPLGLNIRGIGSIMTLSPPLTISEDEIAIIGDRTLQGLDILAERLSDQVRTPLEANA